MEWSLKFSNILLLSTVDWKCIAFRIKHGAIIFTYLDSSTYRYTTWIVKYKTVTQKIIYGINSNIKVKVENGIKINGYTFDQKFVKHQKQMGLHEKTK